MTNKKSDYEMTQYIKQIDSRIDELDNSVDCLNESSAHLERKINRLIEYSRLEAVDLEQINELERRVAELERAVKIHGRWSKGITIGMVFLLGLLFFDLFYWSYL